MTNEKREALIECLDCGRTDGGCDRIMDAPTDDEREVAEDALWGVVERLSLPLTGVEVQALAESVARRTAVQEQQDEPTDDEREALDEPTDRTSNHGWAIWHLTQAKQATSVAEAQMHAACANARAQLQISCEMGAHRGVDPNGPTLWTEECS